MARLTYIVSILFLLIIFSCKQRSSISTYSINKYLEADTAMVVSAHPIASQIGTEILRKGGNAVDAAIAVQFALAVCYPIAGNIGGGGFMVLRDKSGQSYTLDFREKAPLAAAEKMYQDSSGNVVKDLSTLGHLAVGVPGTVDGMWEAFTKFSKLKDWASLVNPSVHLAKNGFKITKMEAASLNRNQVYFKSTNKHQTAFTKETEWLENDILIQQELSKVLGTIEKNGRDGFYKGWVAHAIVQDMQKNEGIITQEDLNTYSSKWRKPIIANYKDHTIISMPPPSSGGIALAQLLKSVETYKLDTLQMHSPSSVHLMVEAERRVYADRSAHLGDSDFYDVPINTLLDSNYITDRMSSFNDLIATPSDRMDAGKIESEQTTHFSIVDSEGNAVSVTTTLNTAYGSKVVVERAGFFLNNEMDDFSAKPGASNYFGLIGNTANKIEPEKRMLSSMTPTIVEKNGKLFMVVGTPGGSTIITSVFQTIVNVVDFKLSIEDAVNAPRFHHQWLPDTIQIEKDCFSKATRSTLLGMGHHIKERSSIGKVEAILVNNGKLQGAADIRGDDSASGY